MKNYQWTAFFLIRAVDDDSVNAAMDLLQDLLEIQIGEDIALILCMSIYKSDLTWLLSGVKRDKEDTDKKEHLTTVFYRIASRKDALGKWRTRMKFIYEKKDFDITNAQDISYYFKRFVLSNHQADRYMLLTWDHGNGYGIFSNNETGTSGSGKTLMMDEMSTAIQQAFGARKVDLMVMMDCDMLTIDTCYALRDTVKYLVASESTVDAVGYNYRAIFKKLAGNPSVSSKKLATYVITSYDAPLDIEVGDKSGTAIFACDLTSTGIYYAMCKKLFDLLLKADKGLMAQVKAAFDGAYYIDGDIPLLDFRSFLKVLEKLVDPAGKVALLCDLMLEAHGTIVLKGYVGSIAKEEAPSFDLEPEGFSFYFPLGSYLADKPGQFLQTSFAKAFKMRALLLRFQPPLN